MTITDRYSDVAKRTGLSEDIIREVYRATKESLIDSLNRGESATLPGICILRLGHVEGMGFDEDNQIVGIEYKKVRIRPVKSFEDILNRETEEVEIDNEAVEELNYVKEDSEMNVKPIIALM